MGKRMTNRKKNNQFKKTGSPLSQEIKGIIIVTIALILAVGIYTKQGGIIGEWIKQLSLGLLGIGAYFLPVVFTVIGILILFKKQGKITKSKLFAASAIIILLSTFLHILYLEPDMLITSKDMSLWSFMTYYFHIGNWNNGGLLGALLANLLLKLVGRYGGYIVIISLFIVLFIFQSNPLFEKVFILLEESLIAGLLYEYNLLLKWITGIFVL